MQAKRHILLLLLICSCLWRNHSVYAQHSTRPIEELPHIFFKNNSTTLKWVENGTTRQVNSDDRKAFTKYIGLFSKKLQVDLRRLLVEGGNPKRGTEAFLEQYDNVQRFAAVSDLHGQHDLFVKLLQQHRIIDQHGDWIYGNGHLVIVGDIMDRGDKVTESLWLLVKLEKQATKKGGAVHYVIGNHELMVFDNDLRYIHHKYQEIADMFGVGYHQFFAQNTFFGRWLKQKPVVIGINNILFTHGGISPEFVTRGLTGSRTNQLFVDSIFTQPKQHYRKNEELEFLTRSKGPLWYRGYFTDTSFNAETLNFVLHGLKKDHIVVGHTSHPTIVNLYDNRIFGVDSSIKNGKNGEILLYENGIFYRGLLNGERQSFLN
ncbi:metallophosphoesterase [Sphingobacterium sp. SYP-B4668]|uniref:metallophosphoesterase n=1 Tax=Sphingobacterium sp. SYP-B4668 TaxID=2996035 RepID=UPI0022DDF1B6|nr:metallophosphoesterase [Sphingobacterium sp. SYP-B4668]